MNIPNLGVSALIVLVALAGCTSPATDAPNVSVPTADLVFAPGNVTKVAANPNNQAEASLTVSPDGKTILTCFHGFFSSLSPGYASVDGGGNWTRMDFPLTGGIGGDCETALLEDGSWVFLASTVAGATILVSRDEGATWTVNHLAAIPTNGLADRPWIHGVGNEIWLSYMPLNFQPGTIGFTKSTDHGATWSLPVFVGMPGPSTLVVRQGHMVQDGDSVHIPMVRAEPLDIGGRTVQVATTNDGGWSWTIEDVLESDEIFSDWPSMAVTESGDHFLLVTVRSSDGLDIAALHRAPGGSWSDLFTVHDSEGEGSTWPFIDGGTGTNATFVVEGAAINGTRNIWMGRIDARDLSVQQWPLGPGSVEFAGVDHDAMGNAYATWTLPDAQYFVKAGLGVPVRD